MAYCENCGMEIDDNAKFCTNCGAPNQPKMQAAGDLAQDPFAGQPAGNMAQDPFAGQPAQDPFSGQSQPGYDHASAGGGYGTSYGGTNAGGSVYGAAAASQPLPSLNMMEAVQNCFSKYAAFSGRARRSEYWYFVLFNVIVSFVLGVIGNIIFGAPENGGQNILQSIYSLAVLLPSLAVFWRRMHDTGRSGAWFFLNLVPLVGSIILIVFACKDSEPGENQYGPSPKYSGR